MLSTLICYANFGAGFANWFVTLAIDSMVNDLMLLLISWRNEVDDEALAQEAQFAAAARAGAPPRATLQVGGRCSRRRSSATSRQCRHESRMQA